MAEEFKMIESDNDQVDLLGGGGQDLANAFEQSCQLEDLKNQLRTNIPGLKAQPGAPGLDHHQTNNNTEAGDTESSEEQVLKIKQQMKDQ